MTSFCCICRETSDTVDSSIKESFVKLPCSGNGRHELCFNCFLQNHPSGKCPMCRIDYVDGRGCDFNVFQHPNEIDFEMIQNQPQIRRMSNAIGRLSHTIDQLNFTQLIIAHVYAAIIGLTLGFIIKTTFI